MNMLSFKSMGFKVRVKKVQIKSDQLLSGNRILGKLFMPLKLSFLICKMEIMSNLYLWENQRINVSETLVTTTKHYRSKFQNSEPPNWKLAPLLTASIGYLTLL